MALMPVFDLPDAPMPGLLPRPEGAHPARAVTWLSHALTKAPTCLLI